jgi:Tol biopolymer transport system component
MSNEEGWMIYLMNSNGTNLRPITRKTDRSGVHKNPVFTADGRSIIYESDTLYIVDINTGETKPVFAQESSTYHTYQNVVVSPNGRNCVKVLVKTIMSGCIQFSPVILMAQNSQEFPPILSRLLTSNSAPTVY